MYIYINIYTHIYIYIYIINTVIIVNYECYYNNKLFNFLI